MRAGNVWLMCFGSALLIACGAHLPKPSGQHIQSENAGLEQAASIPQAIQRAIPLPPPVAAPKVETYSVVVTNVTAQEVLFALARDAKINGTDDNRYLWPEMLRVIRDFKPTWVIAVNVRGLLTINEGMVFEQVCLDLEREGYEVQPLIIPAVSVNAPHRRDRIWIIANRQSIGNRRRTNKERRVQERKLEQDKPKRSHVWGKSERCPSNFTNTTSEGWERREYQEGQSARQDDWNRNWIEVATELCRVDDGLSPELDFAGWSKAGHRVQRLKALGNAIVPQGELSTPPLMATRTRLVINIYHGGTETQRKPEKETQINSD